MRLLGKALTFDDVLLVPAYSHVLPRDTDLSTRLSRRIALNLPLVSAAMDTVTEARLAIAMAQEGGIGIVHKNLTPKQQAAEVARVKRYESGLLRDPLPGCLMMFLAGISSGGARSLNTVFPALSFHCHCACAMLQTTHATTTKSVRIPFMRRV